jgi:hypothetical protein
MASNSNVGSAAGGGGQIARNWSMYGLIHSITRNRSSILFKLLLLLCSCLYHLLGSLEFDYPFNSCRLNPGRADDLVYVHQKLRLISKRSANSIGKKRAAPLQLTSFFLANNYITVLLYSYI